MKTNTIILIISILVVAAGAYWYFSTGTGNDQPLTAQSTDNEAQIRFQTLLSELNPITFDTGIFTDPRFNALVDLTTPVTSETPGRLDPFAPVSGLGE